MTAQTIAESNLITIEAAVAITGLEPEFLRMMADPAEPVVLSHVVDGEVRHSDGRAIATGQITEQRKTTSSLMPDNFGQSMSPADFNDLIAFLAADQPKSAELPAVRGQ